LYTAENKLNTCQQQIRTQVDGQSLEGGEETRLGMAIRVQVPDIRWVLDPTGTGTGMIFYPRVTLIPDPNRDEYGTGIFFHPRVTRRVPDTLLPL
jgi:hypothetical protein